MLTSNDEENAMRELLNDISIVIRPSDKSPGVVILNREDYELKGGVIDNHMRKFLLPNGTCPGKVKQILSYIRKIFRSAQL